MSSSRPSITNVGGVCSNPSGRATLPVGCPSPILAEGPRAPFPEWRRRRQPMCQMPIPSATIVRCPRPTKRIGSDAHGAAPVLSAPR